MCTESSCDADELISDTLSSHEIQTAVRLILPGELAKHAVSEGTKAVTKFVWSREPSSKSRKGLATYSRQAGLVFPVALVRSLVSTSCGRQLSTSAAVYLTAVLEYMTAEVIELSGNVAMEDSAATMTNKHIALGISSDCELEKIFDGHVIGGGIKSEIDSSVSKFVPER